MIGQPADDPDPLDPLGQVLHDYYTRLERGEEVDRDEFIKSYPDQAGVLRDHFDGIDRLEALVNRLPAAVRGSRRREVCPRLCSWQLHPDDSMLWGSLAVTQLRANLLTEYQATCRAIHECLIEELEAALAETRDLPSPLSPTP